MDDRVAKAGYETVNSMLENIQKMRKIELTEAQTKAIAESIAIAWYNAGTNRMNATTAADQVTNELTKIMGDLDIKEKTLLKDWIYQGVHAGVAQTKAIAENIAIAWYNAGTNRMNATTATDHVTNELIKITGDLDIRERMLLKDWIYQGAIS